MERAPRGWQYPGRADRRTQLALGSVMACRNHSWAICQGGSLLHATKHQALGWLGGLHLDAWGGGEVGGALSPRWWRRSAAGSKVKFSRSTGTLAKDQG